MPLYLSFYISSSVHMPVGFLVPGGIPNRIQISGACEIPEEIDMPPRLFLMPMSYIMLLGAFFGGLATDLDAVEAGQMALVATVASGCIYDLDSLLMSNKWVLSGVINMRVSQKQRILQILSKIRLEILFKHICPETPSETSSCWESLSLATSNQWCISSFSLADWNYYWPRMALHPLFVE